MNGLSGGLGEGSYSVNSTQTRIKRPIDTLEPTPTHNALLITALSLSSLAVKKSPLMIYFFGECFADNENGEYIKASINRRQMDHLNKMFKEVTSVFIP